GYVPGFEILNRLGAGVFGVVFKARKLSIGKLYAIKFLKVDDDSVKEAVRREIESVRVFAQIDHPNLVSIEDRGEVDGIPYIVMEYAGEETLRRRLESGPLAPAEALRIFEQVARGVDALHERGLAHFDLKPANVFLKGGTARVGDYGLSKLISESRQTLSFGRGTPYYMSPEMLRRHGDHRSDIYSLGCLLYEMATGEVPFKGETEWEVLRRHENEPVSFPEGFPAEFRGAIERCMEKDPARRYPDVASLLADLEGKGANGRAGAERGGDRREEASRGPTYAGVAMGMRDRVRVFALDLRELRRRMRRNPPPNGSGPAEGAGLAGAAGGAAAATAGTERIFETAAAGIGGAARGLGAPSRSSPSSRSGSWAS
ncbi:MAG TPA: serine/threonine-protein kinase, partial [Planctomycetota bacterium]|nr:serine/threonine-protein kinase [Planctomycetota bacterium]